MDNVININAQKNLAILDSIFQHEKCSGFSPSQKQEVQKAYDFAASLYIGQFRHNKTPSINHIDRSISIYLNETLHSDEPCNPEYLMALILHDSIEDHPDGLQEIVRNEFDINIILDILWMSKPTPSVISQVAKIQQSNPSLWSELHDRGFHDLYSVIQKNNPEKFALQLTASDRLTDTMSTSLRSLWFDFFAEKYTAQTTTKNQQEIFAEFVFLSMIASMERELFRIKATERRDNMRDIEGLLQPNKVQSAIKTMKTTTEIYIPRAREIGDYTLAMSLRADRVKELVRFVKHGLIHP